MLWTLYAQSSHNCSHNLYCHVITKRLTERFLQLNSPTVQHLMEKFFKNYHSWYNYLHCKTNLRWVIWLLSFQLNALKIQSKVSWYNFGAEIFISFSLSSFPHFSGSRKVLTDNNWNLYTLLSICSYGVKLQMSDSCLNAYATFSIMYVCFLFILVDHY